MESFLDKVTVIVDYNDNSFDLSGLNELNLEYIKFYSNKRLLPNFKKLFDNFELIETDSEKKYEIDQVPYR